MSKLAVRVNNLSKKYYIGGIKASYRTFRESITDGFYSPFRRILKIIKGNSWSALDMTEEIWALKDISFEVKPCEAIGIIGRNGAGKSTLLKIFSRITEPTQGTIEMRGRIGSLLEIGTGFHPELTGRDNIFLNGAILGMRKFEIKRRFDEIVAFSEVDKFLDTPVKFYSSGMYVRLAFAVAAHLDPEILLVDEVLAVGDINFQKKCLGKMGEVANKGRTVFFVSHNIGMINKFCSKVLLLDKGKIQIFDNPQKAIAMYLNSSGDVAKAQMTWNENNNKEACLRAIKIKNHDQQISSTLDIRFPFFIEIEYQIIKPINNIRVGFRIAASDGTIVFTTTDTNNHDWKDRLRKPGVYISRCKIPGSLLNEGMYTIFNVWIDIPFVNILSLYENVLTFNVLQTGGVGGGFAERWTGVVCPDLSWDILEVKNKAITYESD